MTRALARPLASLAPFARCGIACALLLACGCGFNDGLPTYYGRHEIGGQTASLKASVNGTDVLAGMFSEAGHNVYFRTSLVTSQMQGADTIVWIPNAYEAPSDEVVDWFETWLSEGTGRTVIYVGRDYDAALQYWQATLPHVSGPEKREYELNLESAKLSDRYLPTLDEEGRECLWFLYEQPEESPTDGEPDGDEDTPAEPDEKPSEPDDAPDGEEKDGNPEDGDEEDSDEEDKAFAGANVPFREVRQIEGPWAAGIDASQAGIRLRTRMIPEQGATRLLESDGDMLVARHAAPYAEDSQLILVANGSFLLNLPLVNHQNRKLAGKLIAATGEAGSVVFLESGPGPPPIDPPSTDASIWTLFGAFPLNVILLQLAVVGVIFCFARWPIFGRPRRPPPEPASDFAHHIVAVGQMLSRTKDRNFAARRASHAAEPSETIAAEAVPSPPEPKGK
ncbi:MAG: hypothetical protein DWQ37_22445 [Planctomycetota bacterium]|nr:MAG: hypothetical protein DWQ37_22445 [Planctomycetota bacterium]